MPDDEKLARLVQDVVEACLKGTLRWVETADTSEFVSVMSGGKLSIKSLSTSGLDYLGNPDDYPCISVNRRSDDLELLKITRRTPGVTQDELNSIHQMARASALGVDEAIDDILKDLETLNDIRGS